MKELNIREIRKDEYNLLEDFLYEAIFIPKGTKKPLRQIIKNEELQVYIKDFGINKDDNCLVAEYKNKIVGTCWTRIMNDYGHIDNATPSFAISLYEDLEVIHTPIKSVYYRKNKLILTKIKVLIYQYLQQF